MKVRGIFWGLFFIAAGALIIASQLGFLASFSLWSLILTVFLVPIAIESAIHLNFFGVFFSLAGIGIIYAEPLGIASITPWPILITALFLSIGFTIIFGKHYTKRFGHHIGNGAGVKYGYDHGNFETVVNDSDESNVKYDVSFSSSIKYVNSADLKIANLSCSFGALTVYFDNSVPNLEGAEIQIDVSFGAAELYIPKTWRVVNRLNVSLGGVDEKNRSMPDESSPTVTLTGSVSLGAIEIIYI